MEIARPAFIEQVTRLFPSWSRTFDHTALQGFESAQSTAIKAAEAVACLLQPGWTEKQAASLLNQYLRDVGVRDFFHYAFAWFGERTRFTGVQGWADFSPSQRCLMEGEPFILDVAPVVNGYVVDIGYSGCYGENSDWNRLKDVLGDLRGLIPQWATESGNSAALWKRVHDFTMQQQVEVAHTKYPFAVLGHRVFRAEQHPLFRQFALLGFGWPAYRGLLGRGVFGQLLSPFSGGDLQGLWAIEPHLALRDVGAKFEELLHVEEGTARWLRGSEQSLLQEGISRVS